MSYYVCRHSRSFQPARQPHRKKSFTNSPTQALRSRLSSPNQPVFPNPEPTRLFLTSRRRPLTPWQKRSHSPHYRNYLLALSSGVPCYFTFLDLIDITVTSKGKSKPRLGTIGSKPRLTLMPSLCAQYGQEIHPLTKTPIVLETIILGSKTVAPDILSLRVQAIRYCTKPDFHRTYPEKYLFNPYVHELNIYTPGPGCSFHLFCQTKPVIRGSVDVFYQANITLPIPPNYPKNPS